MELARDLYVWIWWSSHQSCAVTVITAVDFDCRDHAQVVVVLENIWAEVVLLELVAALIVASMAIGLEIAKPETGRTNVTDVEKEAI